MTDSFNGLQARDVIRGHVFKISYHFVSKKKIVCILLTTFGIFFLELLKCKTKFD